jgi:hypothetical protein
MTTIDVKFNITSGQSGGDEILTLTLPFPRTATINDFLINQYLIQKTPSNKTPKFIYKTQILKPEDTLASIGYDDPGQFAAITVVYIPLDKNNINYIFICLKPDGREMIKSLMINKTIIFDELKEYIKTAFHLSDEFKLIGPDTEINSTKELFNILPTVPIIIDDSKKNPLKGGRRRRSSTSCKSSSSRRRRSTKRSTASRKQQKRRRGSRRAH